MRIVQITANDEGIYGLGEDNQIYKWDRWQGWYLHKT